MKKWFGVIVATLGCAYGSSSVTSTPEAGPVFENQDAYFHHAYRFNKGKDVQFHYRVLNNLSFLYDDLEREMPLCVFGSESESAYWVDHVSFPYYVTSDSLESSFRLDDCHVDPTYLGLVHNHYQGLCGMSLVDFQRFMKDEEAELEIIVCNSNRENSSINMSVVRKIEDGGVLDGEGN